MVGLNNENNFNKTCNNILNNVVDLYLSIFPDCRFIQCLWHLDIIDEEDYFHGIEIVDRYKEEPCKTISRIFPKIVRLINEEFDVGKATLIQKLKCINLISMLVESKFTTQVDKFKIANEI